MGKYSRKIARMAKKELILGSICCNCGRDCADEIEYHHIVPLERGGKDILSNLAPVCYECHSVIHFDFERKKPERIGRRRKITDEALLDNVFRRYVDCAIMEREARQELGTGSRIKDMVQFKEWAEKNGIDASGHFGRGGPQHK